MCKVNKETAELELHRFADTMCLDLDRSHMAPDDVESFDMQKHRIIKAICKGSLVISENGEPIYTPVRSENKEPITFYEPKGDALAAGDRKHRGQDMAKLFETMGVITQTHATRFVKMMASDVNVCMAIALLFLA